MAGNTAVADIQQRTANVRCRHVQSSSLAGSIGLRIDRARRSNVELEWKHRLIVPRCGDEDVANGIRKANGHR